LFNWLWKDNRKFFRFIKEKNTGKILITGLENKDYNNIDFNKKPKTVPQYLGQNEYVFEGKNEK